MHMYVLVTSIFVVASRKLAMVLESSNYCNLLSIGHLGPANDPSRKKTAGLN